MKKKQKKSISFSKFNLEEELNKSFVDILSNVMNKKDIEIVPFPNGEKVTSIMSKLDKWVEKTILSNSKTVMVRGETYPYKNYSHIDELIRSEEHTSELQSRQYLVC